MFFFWPKKKSRNDETAKSSPTETETDLIKLLEEIPHSGSFESANLADQIENRISQMTENASSGSEPKTPKMSGFVLGTPNVFIANKPVAVSPAPAEKQKQEIFFSHLASVEEKEMMLANFTVLVEEQKKLMREQTQIIEEKAKMIKEYSNLIKKWTAEPTNLEGE